LQIYGFNVPISEGSEMKGRGIGLQRKEKEGRKGEGTGRRQ